MASKAYASSQHHSVSIVEPSVATGIVCLSHWMAGKAHFSCQHHSVCIAEPFVATGWPVCVCVCVSPDGQQGSCQWHHSVCIAEPLVATVYSVCHTGWPAKLTKVMPVVSIFSLYCWTFCYHCVVWISLDNQGQWSPSFTITVNIAEPFVTACRTE